ncbi:MAG: peroxiredoxin-like family protein [bacterium]
MLCQEQVAQLRGVTDEVRRRGAEILVVGSGRPDQAARFREEQNIGFPLLVDPQLEAYRAAGLRRGVRRIANLRTLAHSFRAMRKGFRQKRTQGDPWQLGGTFVIAPGARVLFRHVSREAGDHPDTREILDALDRAAHG